MNREELGIREFSRATAGAGPTATGRVREASPVLAAGVESFIFADVFSRSGLPAREREMLTVAVLATIGGAENQLGVHVPAALACGADGEEMLQLCEQLAPYAGFPRALNALRVVRAALEERGLPLPPAAVDVALDSHTTLVSDRGEGDEGDLLLHAPELDRRMWRDLMHALPEGRRAVAPDMRGAGAAAAAPAPGSAADLVADAIGVMDALGLGRVRVVAQGGAAALAGALVHAAPERISSLVLVGPVRPGEAGGTEAEDPARWLRPGTLAADPWAARYVRDRVRRLDREGWAATVAALAAVDPTQRDGHPVRVLLGADDHLCEEDVVAVAWLGATVERVPGAAHLAPVEAPAATAALLGV